MCYKILIIIKLFFKVKQKGNFMYKNIFNLINVIILIMICSQAQASSEKYSEIKQVSSAVFNQDFDSLTLKVKYLSGGCDPKERSHKIALELVSIKDITSDYARESDSLPEYEVKVKAKVMEGPLNKSINCAMAFTIEVTEDLRKLFNSNAEKFGIDLNAKKAHYSVIFLLAPKVVSNTTFSAFE